MKRGYQGEFEFKPLARRAHISEDSEEGMFKSALPDQAFNDLTSS